MGDHLQEMCCEIGPKHPQPRRITSLQVSTLLLEKKISMVGTVRTNSKGLTKFMTKNDNELHKSSFYSMMAKRSYVLTTCARKKKIMNLTSTMHNTPRIDQSKNKKPCVIHFRKSKVGVDVVDKI